MTTVTVRDEDSGKIVWGVKDEKEIDNLWILNQLHRDFQFSRAGIVKTADDRIIEVKSAEELQAIKNITITITRED